MGKVKLIKSLGIIFLFTIGIYFLLVGVGGYIVHNNKVEKPAPVFDSTEAPQTQQEYESMVVDNCLAAQQDYKNQYIDAVIKCNKDKMCIKNTKNLGAGADFISTCVQATVLNDEMSTEIMKGYAQQTELSAYSQQAKTLSDVNLALKLKEGLTALVKVKGSYDINLGLQMNAYMTEYYTRDFTDSQITDLANSVLDKVGPCWGIPAGQCRE